jgi:hypothetical protein
MASRKTAVGLVEKIQQAGGGRELALMAGVLAHGIGARLFIPYRFDPQHHVHHRP